jgi:hypothetical protein
VVALVLSILIAVLGVVVIVQVGKRRPVGAPLSWGEAMLAATLGFALLFWVYGVVPHQWLSYSENELAWRSDKILVGPSLGFTGEEGVFAYFLPFTVSYQTISHTVAVLIYGVVLGVNVWVFSHWQNRAKVAKERDELEAVSDYGRPLVKQG